MASEDKAIKSCFVVGPIGDEGDAARIHADWLFEGIVQPVVSEFKEFGTPTRADKISRPGMIDTQIIERLLADDLVIADLSNINPNAFYEIGIRHVSELPIIHMQLKGESLPFDVAGFRAIKFSLRHPSEIEAAKVELRNAIKEILAEGYRVENPVTHVRGRTALEASATPRDQLLFEEIRALSARVGQLEYQAEMPPPASSSYFSGAAPMTGAYSAAISFSVRYNALQLTSSHARVLAVVQSVLPKRIWSVTEVVPGHIIVGSYFAAGEEMALPQQVEKIKAGLLALPGVQSVSNVS
ncbi:MAG: hypothetical protein U1E93_08990 [Alphaproteobacteria bacterium]